jgi:two-component system, NtrC family, sensor kinase
VNHARHGSWELTLPFEDDSEFALRERITELERERDALREQIFELQRAAEGGLLTGGLAHDLSNQLTTLMGSAELALMQGHPDALREGLNVSMRQGRRIHETVDAFLQFVRRREGRARVFEVKSVMESLDRLVQPVARAEGVEFLESCATRASICADRQLIEQVLVNLSMNAVRAASVGAGKVMASATDGAPGFVRITVRDTGLGFRSDIKERLFQPFATGHAGSGGTGLGLYVARQIVQRCGGTIQVESSPSGARVEVDLPTVG